jgi:threonine/homoserine/homoserine lactone efflux protein
MTELFASLPSAFQTFVFTSLLIELTPGPNMGYLAVVTISQGKRAGYAAVAGVTVGLLTIGLVAAFGLAGFLQTNDFLYQGLRYAGVLFLLYLAWEGWRDSEVEADVTKGAPAQFLRGLLNNLLNPKAALFYVAVLPRFIDKNGPLLDQTIILTLAYVGIATIIHITVVTLASSFRLFMSNPKREQFIRRTLSLALAVFALWFAWSTAR